MTRQKQKRNDYQVKHNNELVGFITWDNGVLGQNSREPWAFMRTCGRIKRFAHLKDAKDEVIKSYGATAQILKS